LNQTIDVLSQKYIEVVKWPQVNQTIVEGYDCLALTWGKSKKNNQKCQFCLILI
jgi:BarA-like signal transduction histidine kinase